MDHFCKPLYIFSLYILYCVPYKRKNIQQNIVNNKMILLSLLATVFQPQK